MAHEDFIQPGSVGLMWSLVFGALVLGLVWGGFIAWMFVRARQLSKLQDHENTYMHERATWRLVSGPSRVVHGRVAVDDSSGIAVEIDVHQSVQNHTSKNHRWHTWNEIFRQTQARPFKLERDDGQLVLVEPGNDVLVVDGLPRPSPMASDSQRVRSAKVMHGADVFVYGDLFDGASGGAYRGGNAFVLRPRPGGRLLVATEAMRDRYRERIGFLRKAAAVVLVLFCLVDAFMLPFVAACTFGKQVTAEVPHRRHFVTYGKHGPIQHYELTGTAPGAFSVSQEVPLTTYNDTAQPAEIPMVRTSDLAWASYLGTEPTLPIPLFVIGFVIEAISVLVVLTRYGDKRAWYDRKRLNEMGGPGHWRG